MKVYFIGIGGTGLSALAYLCKKLGYEVLGSDSVKSDFTNNLENNGIQVFSPQSEDNISNDVDLVIYSAAINPGSLGDIELQRAKELEINCQRREYLLDQILKKYISIGICGTHGKTTTTSLLTHCLLEMGEDPSYSIGGILNSNGKNSDIGKGKYFVWEADEYSNAFLGVHVNYAIVNNIEYDHPDFFKTEDEYLNSFKEFIENNISDKIIVNNDDENIKKLLNNSNKNIITFSMYYSDFSISELDSSGNMDNTGKTIFKILNNNEESIIKTQLYGEHNIYNTTAVFSLLVTLGFEKEKIIKAISTFTGSGRRLEEIYENEYVTVISDYAHHPTAIKTTINGVKSMGKKIVAVFEPHQYSRLKTLYNDFCNSFDEADEVLILPIYAAREKDIPENFTIDFAHDIKNPNTKYVEDYDVLLDLIKKENGNTMFLCMTAGPLDEYLRKNLK